MKTFLLTLLGALPLAALAQQPEATRPPVTYRVGLRRAPLYRRAADTLRPAEVFAPSQAAVSVVGELSSRWVVVAREGFRYLTPAAALVGYNPADADAPPLSATTHRITYEGVVQVPGASQADLFDRARRWVSQTYNQQNAEVEREDAASGLLQLRGTRLAQVYQDYQGVPRATYAGVVRHSLSIYVKDGRYKYVLTDFVHDAKGVPNLRSGGALEQKRTSLFGYGGLGSYQTWTELKTDALRDARTLVAGLEAAMTLQKARIQRSASDF
ncbi:DUF4468 domain-containing protein [Hymenobacter sp. RP-2-7]|uniref:DUF4468 domain-containing protein n=1 Tax=Hymenobacter polaris TaxID=2682546 RepID=A0A7Y0FLD3_9BACT|nr:DUF4468 domain-containing protein [Hymenobacter polaris]NML64380.1 DUF4468 domain-containing protein [Hymenobacter polaris]